ncbi:hypothetical protein IZY60_08695 [Lutibacter sp. B2]|nr:hypothetical protein [Lutibacter sp. B2]
MPVLFIIGLIAIILLWIGSYKFYERIGSMFQEKIEKPFKKGLGGDDDDDDKGEGI